MEILWRSTSTKGDETHRRWKIIDASRAGDPSLLPPLLARLNSDESYENKRHILRALSNIGGSQVEIKLIALPASQQGFILGDIAQFLGKAGLPAVRPCSQGSMRPRVRMGPSERRLRPPETCRRLLTLAEANQVFVAWTSQSCGKSRLVGSGVAAPRLMLRAGGVRLLSR